MASQNPLKQESPLKPKIEFSLKKEERVYGCPRCKSKEIIDYSFVNGTGKTCTKCSYGWQVGHFGGMSKGELQNMLDKDKEYREETLVMVGDNLSLPIQELQQIEETIQNNNDFFRRRLYGDY